MLKFENFCKCTHEMYLFRFQNTPLGGGAATQTFSWVANTLVPPLRAQATAFN